MLVQLFQNTKNTAKKKRKPDMSTFNIRFDPLSKQYDTQFPIFLHDKGIAPDQYIGTLGQASLMIQTLYKPLESFRRAYYITMAVMTVVFIAVAFSPVLATVSSIFIYSFVFSIFFYIIYFVVIIGGLIALAMKSSDTQKKLKQQMTQFLEQENQRLYYARGVQLLYGGSTPTPPAMQYNYAQLTALDIQIVLAQSVFAPTAPQQFQPMPQQSFVIPMAQQQPAEPTSQPTAVQQPTMPQQTVYYNANNTYQKL